MANFFNNLSIKKKINLGFGVILFLLVVSSSIAVFSLLSGNNNFEHYRENAINTNNLGRIQ